MDLTVNLLFIGMAEQHGGDQEESFPEPPPNLKGLTGRKLPFNSLVFLLDPSSG
jgi:hypothetical protein